MKAKSKSFFTTRQRQLKDLLEDVETSYRSIEGIKKKKKLLGTHEKVIEDLASLTKLYWKKHVKKRKHRSRV